MDTNSNNRNDRAGNVSNSPRPAIPNSSKAPIPNATRPTMSKATRPVMPKSVHDSSRPNIRELSAEDKLKKGLKNISYTSNTNFNSNLNNMETRSSSPVINKLNNSNNDPSRRKVGGVVLDIETIKDATKQKIQNQSKRNSVIIVILCSLLIISFIYLAIAVVSYKGSKHEPNCRYLITGDVEAEWIVEGRNQTEFSLKKGLSSNMVYLLDSSINIKTTSTVLLNIEIKVLLNDEPIMIAGLQDMNKSLTRVENSNKFMYENTITGGGIIYLFEGIDFSDAPSNLTSENITIEIIASIEKV